MALVFMRANRKFSASYSVVICGPSGSTIPSSFTFLHKWHDFGGVGVMGGKMYVPNFSTTFF